MSHFYWGCDESQGIEEGEIEAILAHQADRSKIYS